ncbi:phosphatidate cytidylyltransferase [Aquimarina agarivorans]|uniref:phosphatidate cytidylyltransferase n=1 Tax=Aquimarina agarivorans TaxID=980584 RepID=UPI000248EACC|nr:phosphatidate cytidylyltransferase [Aquimarina agarivorans]
MKELYTRAFSGFIYVCILIGSILFHKYSFLGVFFAFSLICLYEFQRLIHFKKVFLYLILISGYYATHFIKIPDTITWSFLFITLFIQLLLLKDLLFIRIIPMFEKKKYVVSIFYLISCFFYLTLIPFDKFNNYRPVFIIGLLVLIWVNDSFAYLTGKNFGKHKLYPKISPKKTVEGFLGGFFAAIIGGVLIYYFSNSLSILHWIVLAIIVSVFGTIGDLIQSKFKRQAGVKDSGKIMPGHGGIFDRLDSILYASPFVFLYLQIISYVS